MQSSCRLLPSCLLTVCSGSVIAADSWHAISASKKLIAVRLYMDHCDACDELGVAWEMLADEYSSSSLFGAYDLNCQLDAEMCRLANASKLAPLVLGDPAGGLQVFEPVELAPIFAADWLYPALRDALARQMPLCRWETQGDCNTEEAKILARSFEEPLGVLEERVIKMFPVQWWQLKVWQQGIQDRYASWSPRFKNYLRKRFRLISRRPRAKTRTAPAPLPAPKVPGMPPALSRAPAALPKKSVLLGKFSFWLPRRWYRKRAQKMRQHRILSRSLKAEYAEIAHEWAEWTKASAFHRQQVASTGYYLMRSVKVYRDELEQYELEEAICAEEDREEEATWDMEMAERRPWDKDWEELTEAERKAALQLGMATREQWDDGESLMGHYAWSTVLAKHGTAVAVLGFTEQNWYYATGGAVQDASEGDAYYVASAEGARLQATAMAYYAQAKPQTESLDSMSPQERAVAVQLGLSDTQGFFWRPWDELSQEQRSLAVDLGRAPPGGASKAQHEL